MCCSPVLAFCVGILPVAVPVLSGRCMLWAELAVFLWLAEAPRSQRILPLESVVPASEGGVGATGQSLLVGRSALTLGSWLLVGFPLYRVMVILCKFGDSHLRPRWLVIALLGQSGTSCWDPPTSSVVVRMSVSFRLSPVSAGIHFPLGWFGCSLLYG